MLDLNTNPCALMPRKKRRTRMPKRPCIRLTIKTSNESGTKSQEGATSSECLASTSTQTFCAFDRLFVAEESAMRVSYFELQIDDGPVCKQKNSGIEFSVQKQLNQPKVDSAQLNDILNLFKKLGYDIQPPDGREESAEELCERIESMGNVVPEKPGLTYRLKEPVFNKTFKSISECGSAKRIWLLSKCTKGQLFIDNDKSVPFNFGSELLIEYCPDVSV
ncbi:NAD(+) kinase [Aphelenchoides bicaudatus]|nr:NAD(+) kinase [Aphelenchoides bicaudatus]